MSNVLTANVSVQGTRPLLWHRFGPDAIPLEKRERAGVAGNDPTEWRRTVLYTPEGQLYLEPTYIFGCLCNAAKYTKTGRGSIQTLVKATLMVVDNRILIDRFIPNFNGGLPADIPTDPTLPVYLDIRMVRNPQTKGANVRYRVAASQGWKASFSITWDRTVVDRGQMEAVMIDAGKLIGLGDGRSIGFGRFTVEAFEVVE